MQKGFLLTLIASFVLAIIAFMNAFQSGKSGSPLIILWCCWLALFGFALFAFRRRGLWLLLSAPIAFGPVLLFVFLRHGSQVL